MKTLLCAAALTTLFTGQVLAQAAGNPAQNFANPTVRAPDYQQGSGQRAGGYASELNRSPSVPPTTGTVAPRGGAPEFQQGSGQRSGGPARERIPAR